MYLTYEEYRQMGGSLDGAAFAAAERRARYFIDSQAGGKTGERIANMPSLPQAVKDCVFDLIAFAPDEKQISGESQSQGGTSESVSYAVKTAADIGAEQQDIVYRYLVGVKYNGASVLYRGACV